MESQSTSHIILDSKNNAGNVEQLAKDPSPSPFVDTEECRKVNNTVPPPISLHSISEKVEPIWRKEKVVHNAERESGVGKRKEDEETYPSLSLVHSSYSTVQNVNTIRCSVEKENDHFCVLSFSTSLPLKEQNEAISVLGNNKDNHNSSSSPLPSSSLSAEQENDEWLWKYRQDLWKDQPELDGFYPMYTGEYDDHHRPQGKGCYHLEGVFGSTSTTTPRKDIKANAHLLPIPSPSSSSFLFPGGKRRPPPSRRLIPQPTPRILNMLYYDGNWERGEIQGEGVAVYADGSSYKGSFHHNKKHGKGILFYPSSPQEKYTSLPSSLSFTSPFPVYPSPPAPIPPSITSSSSSSSSPHVYEGEFYENRKHGMGRELFKSGARYDGAYERGERCGSGKYIFPDGVTVFHGEWKNNLFHGYGRLQYANHDTYEGFFKEGKPHGKGKGIFSSTGCVYDGDWFEGVPHAPYCDVQIMLRQAVGGVEPTTSPASYYGYARNGKVVCQRKFFQ